MFDLYESRSISAQVYVAFGYVGGVAVRLLCLLVVVVIAGGVVLVRGNGIVVDVVVVFCVVHFWKN